MPSKKKVPTYSSKGVTSLWRFVEVIWDDAHMHASWEDPTDKKLATPARCVARGWLVSESKAALCLASCIAYTDEAGKLPSEEDVGPCLTIPIGMVVEMKDIK